jgi:hypothetical protein
MEMLLRRHARRKVRSASNDASDASTTHSSTPGPGTHLDADEMNAYAEGALPAAARARYISHLADCDQCRTLVARLTIAANVPLEDRESIAEQSTLPASSWREWLAALFAPPMIRYGATALALLCVVGVAFLAIRQQRASRQNDGPTFVARNDQREGQSASAVKPEAGQQSAPPQSSPVVTGNEPAPVSPGDNKAVRADAPADAEAGKSEKEDNGLLAKEKSRANTQPSLEAAPRPANEPAQQQAARDEGGSEVVLDGRASAAPPSAATTTPSDSVSRVQERGAEADNQGENRKDGAMSDDSQRARRPANNTAARETEEIVTATKSAPSTEARRRPARRAEPGTAVGGAGSGGADLAAAKPAETRSVSGRQFRRQGGAWVDTAYASGRATVNVTRGSEQYRALVADEPPLRTIAEQLGGEVIVVWKGRAYRIH